MDTCSKNLCYNYKGKTNVMRGNKLSVKHGQHSFVFIS